MSEESGKKVAEPETLDRQEKIDPEELKSVKDLLQALTKTAKTLKIYLPNNPIHQKHLKELTEKFSAHLNQYHSLALEIQQYQLLFHHETVYENTNRLESFAFKFYIDGLRELTFHEGLEPEEIFNLLEIMGQEFDPSNPNDDMVTLLWEKHFTHMSYAVVEEFLEEDAFIQADQKMDQNPNQARERQALLREEIQKAAEEYEAQKKNRPERPYSQVFQLNEDEIGWVKNLMEIEEKRDLRMEMIIILGSILRIEEEDKVFEKCLVAIRRVLGILIAQGDFYHAAKVLELYREILQASPGPSPHHQLHLQQALEWGGERDNFREIEKILKIGNLEDTENFLLFLSLLDQNAIPNLVELLGTINQMKVRRLVCEALVVLGKDDISGLVGGLRDSRWFVIRNLVYVLGKIGDPKGLEHFKRLSYHPEGRVRKEVLSAISSMGNEQVEGIYLAFLKDPDQTIRQQVIRWVSSSQSKEGLKGLQRMVGEIGFNEKEILEKQEIFNSIAKIGGDSVVPFLEGFMIRKRKFWFSDHRQDELSICAVSALKKIKGEAALTALQGGAESRNKTTREACKKALVGSSRS